MTLSSAGDRIQGHRYRDALYLTTINVSALILNPIVVAYAMDPLLVTFWRCFFGALIFIPIAMLTQPKFYQKITKNQWGFMLLAGCTLAMHFISLMEGLYRVSLGVAVTIMSTGTIWVGLLGIVLLKQMLTAGQWTGLIAGFGGILLYAFIGNSLEAKSSAAIIWLLVSSLSGAIYIVIGQKVRANITNFAYVAVVFSVAAIISFTYALITSHPITVEQSSDWVGIALITFFGQIMVHTVTNLYLKHGEAALLQLSVLVQIPVVAIIGWLLFEQKIGIEVIPALLLTIVGLVIYNLAQPKSSTSNSELNE